MGEGVMRARLPGSGLMDSRPKGPEVDRQGQRPCGRAREWPTLKGSECCDSFCCGAWSCWSELRPFQGRMHRADQSRGVAPAYRLGALRAQAAGGLMYDQLCVNHAVGGVARGRKRGLRGRAGGGVRGRRRGGD